MRSKNRKNASKYRRLIHYWLTIAKHNDKWNWIKKLKLGHRKQLGDNNTNRVRMLRWVRLCHLLSMWTNRSSVHRQGHRRRRRRTRTLTWDSHWVSVRKPTSSNSSNSSSWPEELTPRSRWVFLFKKYLSQRQRQKSPSLFRKKLRRKGSPLTINGGHLPRYRVKMQRQLSFPEKTTWHQFRVVRLANLGHTTQLTSRRALSAELLQVLIIY